MEFLETTIFTQDVTVLLTDDEYRMLQAGLYSRPDLGDLIPSTGGLRKVRWGARGKGKSGGVRVIYYWVVSREIIYMLLIYPKSARDDLTPAQKKQLASIVREEFP